jgi:hypothetical protein
MEQAFTDLANAADLEDELSEAKPAPRPTPKTPPKAPVKAPVKPAPKAEAKPQKELEQPIKENEREEQEEQENPEGKTEIKPEDKDQLDPKGKRIKPWDLLDKFKVRAISAERELAEIKSKNNGHEVPKEALDKITTLEARNQELENEIRFTNYEKSKEYQEQYNKPYMEAWDRAVGELNELTITDANGHVRQAGAKDLLILAKMPLGEAREYAEAKFGKAADDVMAHRRVVRELANKQHKALEEARSNGGEREKQQNLERETKERANSEKIAKEWHSINAEARSKYEFLKPVEGQQERNEKLEKAIKFVDDSLNLNLSQAKTEQERQDILRRHSALRNRAIGFSVLKHENKSLKAEIEDLKKSLAEFQTSEPTAGEQGHDPGSSISTDPMEAAMHGLAQLAE